ncbi:MAG: hypothetical protein WCQ95_03605 [Bacteroidota bacterium]
MSIFASQKSQKELVDGASPEFDDKKVVLFKQLHINLITIMAAFAETPHQMLTFFDETIVNYVTHPTNVSPETSMGSCHGTVTNSVTNLPPTNCLIALDGVADLIFVDDDGTFSCTDVPISCTHGKATADGCADVAFDIVITPDGDTNLDITMEPVASPPPDNN